MSSKPVIADEPAAGLTFKEKSLWVTLVSTVVLYGYYFVRALQIGDGDPGAAGGLFLAVVIVFTAIHVVINAALAIHRRPERSDERDRAVARKAAAFGYYVMMTGLWGTLGVAVLRLGAFWFVHAGLFTIVTAEIVRCAAQLAYYRRGA
ncbi:MAG TPA: hypothetical protein VFP84_23230 [Kofleriaceae bacterium]|nr:hypothetical protein [Kofleriaceae bacterium]